MPRVTVIFHGPLGGGRHEIVAETAWEAIEGLSLQLPGLQPNPFTGRKVVQAVGFPTLESLRSPLVVEEIHVIPALEFAKNGGLIKTVVGPVLLVTAAFMGGTFWPAIVASLGASFLTAGLSQLISPQPQLNTNDDGKRSRYLGAAPNTVRIGTTIALGYGRRRVGGQLLSVNIDAKDTGI